VAHLAEAVGLLFSEPIKDGFLVSDNDTVCPRKLSAAPTTRPTLAMV